MTRPSNSKICWRSLVKHCATKRSQKHWDLWVKADPIFRFCKMLAKYQDPVETQILSDSTTVWRRGVDKSQEQKTTDGSLRGLSSHSASFINKGYVSKNAPWSWSVFKRNKRWSFHVIIQFISIYSILLVQTDRLICHSSSIFSWCPLVTETIFIHRWWRASPPTDQRHHMRLQPLRHSSIRLGREMLETNDLSIGRVRRTVEAGVW